MVSPDSCRDRSRAASIADKNAARTLLSSNTRNAAIVVPAGLLTSSRNCVGCRSVSANIVAAPITVCFTNSVATARGIPNNTPASIIASTT